MSDNAITPAELRDGEPCKHPGCLSHYSHPCEGCGRIRGRRVSITPVECRKIYCIDCGKNVTGLVRIENIHKPGYVKCLKCGLGVTKRV